MALSRRGRIETILVRWLLLVWHTLKLERNAFHIGFFWWVFGGCVVAITNSFVPLPLSDIWKRAIMMDGGTVCEIFGSSVPTQQGTFRDIWIWAMAPSSATFRKWVGRARPAASGEMCLFREDWACLAASHL